MDFFEIYSKMVWQESERMLLEEPRHEDLNKRSVCPASHAGSCHEWQGKTLFPSAVYPNDRKSPRNIWSKSLLPSPEPNWSRALAAPKAAISLSRHRKNIRRRDPARCRRIPCPCGLSGTGPYSLCPRQKCITLNLYKEIQEAVDSVVDRTTLADLVAQQEAQDKA